MPSTNVKAAVLTKITFKTREGVTREEARHALIKVVHNHFQDVLKIDLCFSGSGVRKKRTKKKQFWKKIKRPWN
jgi:hypothetical protein